MKTRYEHKFQSIKIIALMSTHYTLHQLDINLITPGIYRQRSYDNLKNGESKFSFYPHHRLPRYAQLDLPVTKHADSIDPYNESGYPDDLKDVNSINYNAMYEIENTDDAPSHSLSPTPSALLVPTHYKYYAPQRIHYPYHKNRSVPRKMLLAQEKQRRESERQGIRNTKANDIRVCVDLQSPTDPMQSLLREIDLCDASENDKDPMLRSNRSVYRENKKRFSIGHDPFSRRNSRFSNIYDYSLASIFEDFASDDSL